MDGLTISTAEGLLESGKTVSELNSSRLKKEIAGPDGDDSKSFAVTLNEAIDSVNTLHLKSDDMMQKLSTGEEKNIPEVMIAVEKADIALKLMVQVRNKIIDAYQEVMKMQV